MTSRVTVRATGRGKNEAPHVKSWVTVLRLATGEQIRTKIQTAV
jgi:hypothetical protein